MRTIRLHVPLDEGKAGATVTVTTARATTLIARGFARGA